MEIIFATGTLEKEFNHERTLKKKRGKIKAEKIMLRLGQIRDADHLGQLRPPMPGKFHPLHENLDGWIACQLDGPYRLIFEPNHNPLPTLESGGLDWTKVTSVRILGVIDYHERKKQKPV